MKNGVVSPFEGAVLRSLSSRFRTKGQVDFSNILNGPDYFRARDGVNPRNYDSATSFAKDYLLGNLFKKSVNWTGFKPRLAALRSWIAAEQSCARTNRDLPRLLDTPHWRAVAIFAQSEISRVIGASPDFGELYSLCKFGTGATFDVSRREANVDTKLTRVSSTEGALKYRAFLYASRPKTDERGYAVFPEEGGDDNSELFEFEVVRGNRGVFVPKTAKTDRPIACEPTLNSFVQQGVGRFFKKRLLTRANIDLYDQSINQRLASMAHQLKLATVDLQSASDTLAKSVVKTLLPPAWYDFLNDLRSHSTMWSPGTPDEHTFRLEKFSAMGNAFTFELETLIFYSLVKAAYAVWPSDSILGVDFDVISVYGDDIIVNQRHAHNVVETLRSFGFIINDEKSYLDGRFFESCGKHYFDGVDVTPMHDDGQALSHESALGRLSGLIKLHNRLYRWGLAHGKGLVVDTLKAIRAEFSRISGKRTLPLVPVGAPDIGFLTDDGVLRTDRNGDFSCLVLETRTVYVEGPWTDDKRLYFYWLRTSLTPHSDPHGHSKATGNRVSLTRKRIWRSSVMAVRTDSH